MSLKTESFNLDILNNYSRLHDFFCGRQVKEKVKEQLIDASKQYHTNWLGRWNVVPLLVTLVPAVYLSIFCRVIGNLFYFLNVTYLGLQLDLLADRVMRISELLGYARFGSDLLAPSFNLYSSDAIELYMQPNMKRKSIESSTVRDHVLRDTINFSVNTGCCRGNSLWFIRIYLDTKHLFPDHKAHMQAIGSLFSYGAPKEAALVQKLCARTPLLGFIKEDDPEILIRRPSKASSDAENRAEIVQQFKRLAPGAYYVGTYDHAMAYISIGNGQGYFYDPNMGTVYIHDEDTFTALAKTILGYKLLEKDLLVELTRMY